MLVSVLCLLVLAGCNLGFAPDDSSPSFDGPPEIHIAAPQPEQKYQSGATVIVQARVENAGPDLARVALLLNEQLMAEQLNPNETNAEILPLTMDWPTSDEGEFTIAVIAERGDGSSAREDVSIMVVPRALYQAPETTSRAPPVEADAPNQADESTSPQRAPDLSELPIETGQPPAPGEGVNLVVTSIELLPDPPLCGQPTIVRAILRNSGALDSRTSPWVTAKAHLLSDESVQAENPETVYLPVLEAGEETVLDIPLTLSARDAEAHVIRVTVDHGNHVIETHENDNTGSSRPFELSQGTCGA